MALKYHQKVLSAKSAIDTVGTVPQADQVPHAWQHQLHVEFSGGTSAGAVVMEGAARPDYTGAWSILGTVTWSAATKTGSVSVNQNLVAVRARISVGIVGGTVDAYLDGVG